MRKVPKTSCHWGTHPPYSAHNASQTANAINHPISAATGTATPEAEVSGLYWAPRNVYVAKIQGKIGDTLDAVLRLYDSQIRRQVFIGDSVEYALDFVVSDKLDPINYAQGPIRGKKHTRDTL